MHVSPNNGPVAFLLLLASAFYDLVVLLLALMAAHDNYSKSDISDHSVESALGVLLAAIACQLLVAGAFAMSRRYTQAVIVIVGALPLVAVVTFFTLS